MINFTPQRASRFFNPGAIITAILIVIALILVFTSFYIVDQTERAVITRLGKYRDTTGPGLRFKLPFGIDKLYLVNVTTVHTEQFGFRTLSTGVLSTYASDVSMSTMLTGDLNMVDIEWIIQYRIVDPVAWSFNVRDRERISTIRDVSRSVMNMLVGDRAIMDIMGSERSAIEDAAIDYKNEIFESYDIGIQVIAVKLQNTNPPLGVQDAFDDVNRAIQDRNRLINEGQQIYNEQIPRTRGEADRLIQIAEGYAVERRNHTAGDVARFNAVYEEYRHAPDITIQRLYFEMIEDVFKDNPGTVIIDRRFENFLPMLNLGSQGN